MTDWAEKPSVTQRDLAIDRSAWVESLVGVALGTGCLQSTVIAAPLSKLHHLL